LPQAGRQHKQRGGRTHVSKAQVNKATPLFETTGQKILSGRVDAAGKYELSTDLTGNYANLKLD
jgi:hypothetical protein